MFIFTNFSFRFNKQLMKFFAITLFVYIKFSFSSLISILSYFFKFFQSIYVWFE
ncbi:unnamed protein product [Meloidogyne enterolobii]|uniref:Uncharacterized protein n=1 Tax=Meloidogyne enterolobii TaxID=390850 RepID=A0ACB0Z543_MELEN